MLALSNQIEWNSSHLELTRLLYVFVCLLKQSLFGWMPRCHIFPHATTHAPLLGGREDMKGEEGRNLYYSAKVTDYSLDRIHCFS